MVQIESDGVLKHDRFGFLCIIVAWCLIVCFVIFVDKALESVLEVFSFEEYLPIIKVVYGFLISFLGGSMVTSFFLEKRSFMVQCALSIGFGLLAVWATRTAEGMLQQIPEGIFQNTVISLEYLLLPVFILVLFDSYSSGRLRAFSWKNFLHFLKKVIFHPKRAFEEIMSQCSVLFSFFSVLLVGALWTIRAAATLTLNPAPSHWETADYVIGKLPDVWVTWRVSLVIPIIVLFWWMISSLVHVIARRLDGRGSSSTVTSLLGFAFVPSLITILVDFLEIELLQKRDSFLLNNALLLSDLVIPLILWPLLLAALAIKTSEKLSWFRSILIAAAVFSPLFILLSIMFL